MAETPGSTTVSTKLHRIAMLAKQAPDTALTTLAHHIDEDWLREAYRRTRKDGARGIDGQDAERYAANLQGNLQGLLERAKAGTYRAPPLRRVHIPKGDGNKTRPIGIPTFEDKVLQRAVSMVLEAIYEQDFLSCSYGFRPGRSAHQALRLLRDQTMKMGGGWILEVDIRDFFGSLDHGHLQEMLRRWVRDGVLLRLIGKWLNAGVMEEGCIQYPETGSPQGGVISPVLSNVYLHEVLDVWFEQQVRPRLRGPATLIRYADDALMLFGNEADARKVLDVLPKRLDRYGLSLHPEKTRLVPFRRPQPPQSTGGGGDNGAAGPGTFDLLGFTHVWARSRNGYWVVKQRTARDRMSRALKRIKDWCRMFRHQPLPEQFQKLSLKLRGHYAYYGISGNSGALARFRKEVARIWKKWLGRRSRKRALSWGRLTTFLATHTLAPGRIVHYHAANQ